MALRDQPYLPLYIQDIMTDEKLNECSASTHGIYIKGIMCLMHKSEEYGKILLKQKYKQNGKQNSSDSLALARQLVKHLPYTVDEISGAIDELLEEGVCYFEGNYLCQKRMIRDNEISQLRAESGSKGGKKSSEVFAKAKQQAKEEANSEYENVNEDVVTNKERYQHLKNLVQTDSSERFLNAMKFIGVSVHQAKYLFIDLFKNNLKDEPYESDEALWKHFQNWGTIKRDRLSEDQRKQARLKYQGR